jgi:hypothetical protein
LVLVSKKPVRGRLRVCFRPASPRATVFIPSDPPSKEGSPGEVRSRCPTPAAFWAASLATGPAGLSLRGVSAGFRTAKAWPCAERTGETPASPPPAGPGRRGAFRFFGYFLAAQQESTSPAGARTGAALRAAPAKSRRWRHGGWRQNPSHFLAFHSFRDRRPQSPSPPRPSPLPAREADSPAGKARGGSVADADYAPRRASAAALRLQ